MLKYLKHDLPAGIAVFLVAVPLCLGIAIASGAPLMSGLIAGIIGWIVVGLISNSPLSVSGPAAWLVAIVVTTIADLWFSQFLFALILAGVIQMLLGLVKASKVAKYVPTAVIKGMLAAIGMTLIIKQLPVMMGLDMKNFHREFSAISFNALIIGVVALIVMIIRNKRSPKKMKVIPSSIIAVVVGVGLALIYKIYLPEWTLLIDQLVSLPTNITSLQSAWASLSHPSFLGLSNPQVYISAITIALVASIESILCIQAIDKLDPQARKTSLDRELVAQWVGNIAAWFLGGIPITSVIVRSSVNLNAGAKSKISAIFHGILMIVAILFAANYMNMIPMAVLAAVLVITGYQLTKPSKFIEKYKHGRIEFIPFVITFIVILIEDLLIGVSIGICVYYVMLAMERKWFPRQQLLERDVD